MGRRAIALSSAAVMATCLALAPGLAHGERTQSGNLIVSLNGGISPLELPRDRPAPVAVHLEGEIRSADGSPLPRVARVELELAGRGLLFTRGLAVCPRARLRTRPIVRPSSAAAPRSSAAACWKPRSSSPSRLRSRSDPAAAPFARR